MELSDNASCKERWLRARAMGLTNIPVTCQMAKISNRKIVEVHIKMEFILKTSWQFPTKKTTNFCFQALRYRQTLSSSGPVYDSGRCFKIFKEWCQIQIVSASVRAQTEVEKWHVSNNQKTLPKRRHSMIFERRFRSRLFSGENTMYYRDETFNSAPISSVVLVMAPETSFSGISRPTFSIFSKLVSSLCV